MLNKWHMQVSVFQAPCRILFRRYLLSPQKPTPVCPPYALEPTSVGKKSKEQRPEVPCPRFSQQVLGVRSPEDRQSQQAVEFTRSGVQGSFTPGLLLMAPSDASTSHLSWCKCPWGCRTITAPRIQKLPRGERNEERQLCGALLALLSPQVQGWGMEWGLASSKENRSPVSSFLAKGRLLS